MKSGKRTLKDRRKGAFLVELLVVISIGGMILANTSVRLNSALIKTRWAEANILQQNLQNTYEKWASLGGTHSPPPIGPLNPYIRMFDGIRPEDSTVFTVSSITGLADGSNNSNIQWSISTTATQTRSNEENLIYFVSHSGDPWGSMITFITNNRAISNIPSERSGFRALPAGTNIDLYTYSLNEGNIVDSSPLFVVPTVNQNAGAELTNALWQTFLSGSAPVATGGATMVSDSTQSGVNSTAIRLTGSFPNAPVIDSEDSILLDGMYRIRFNPTGTNKGIWTVTYDG